MHERAGGLYPDGRSGSLQHQPLFRAGFVGASPSLIFCDVLVKNLILSATKLSHSCDDSTNFGIPGYLEDLLF